MILQRCAVFCGVRALSTSTVHRVDPISNVFVNQIRDLVQKQSPLGGLANSNPKYKKQLDEQLSRIAQKYNITSPEIVGKLDVTFDKITIESSVNNLLADQ